MNSFDEVFKFVMNIISMLGSGESYLLVMVLLLWCFDYKSILRFAVYVGITTAATEAMKILIQSPRPFQIHQGIKLVDDFGMPSSHSSSAVVFFGYLCYLFRKKWLAKASLVLVLLIGISRVYLDKHYPSQVIFGFLFGCVLLAVFLLYEYKSKKHPIIILAVCFSLLTIFATMAFKDSNEGIVNLKHLYQLISLITGMSVGGYLLRDKNIKVKVSGKLQLIKVVIFIISLSIFLVLKMIIDEVFIEQVILCLGLTSLLYFVLAFWLSYLGPGLLIRYKLMNIEEVGK